MQSIPEFLLIPSDTRAQASLVALGRLVVRHGAEWSAWLPFLEETVEGAIQIDLGGVTDMDAAGVGLIARIVAYAQRRGRRVCVVAAAPRVRRLLAITRLAPLVRACESAVRKERRPAGETAGPIPLLVPAAHPAGLGCWAPSHPIMWSFVGR